jgi:hypothetical protein
MQIKGWSHKKKEAMMRGDWTEVSCLEKSKSAHPSTGSGRAGLGLPCFLPTPFDLQANIILRTNGFTAPAGG